jgi:hypothetical protein
MPCPQCGFDPATVSPADAIVALRSLPRRFHELIDPDDPDPTIDVEAEQAAAEIERLGRDLEQVLVLDHPTLQGSTSEGTDLGDAVTTVADLASRQPADAWARTALRNGETVSALDLLREAVHAGVHHLRVARGDFKS